MMFLKRRGSVSNTGILTEENKALNIEEYQDWFQAIRTNDDTAVQRILDEAEE